MRVCGSTRRVALSGWIEGWREVEPAGAPNALNPWPPRPLVPLSRSHLPERETAMTDRQATVRQDAAQQRYELRVEGKPLGFAAYSEQGEQMVFTHTEVDPSLSGQGLGSVLAKGALEDARRRGKRVVPQCEFIAKYIQRHEEWQDLVDPA
nr:GNAT family N-acetyltransferase [Stutzerimonas nitrititolerans]